MCWKKSASPAALCDGRGACSVRPDVRCEPFVCQGNACGVHCASDADCAEKFRCDLSKAATPTEGDCVPRNGAFCDTDAHTLVNPDGSRTDCTPYACEGSACRTQCASVVDCVLPYRGGGASMIYIAVLIYGLPSCLIGVLLGGPLLRRLGLRITAA